MDKISLPGRDAALSRIAPPRSDARLDAIIRFRSLENPSSRGSPRPSFTFCRACPSRKKGQQIFFTFDDRGRSTIVGRGRCLKHAESRSKVFVATHFALGHTGSVTRKEVQGEDCGGPAGAGGCVARSCRVRCGSRSARRRRLRRGVVAQSCCSPLIAYVIRAARRRGVSARRRLSRRRSRMRPIGRV